MSEGLGSAEPKLLCLSVYNKHKEIHLCCILLDGSIPQGTLPPHVMEVSAISSRGKSEREERVHVKGGGGDAGVTYSTVQSKSELSKPWGRVPAAGCYGEAVQPVSIIIPCFCLLPACHLISSRYLVAWHLEAPGSIRAASCWVFCEHSKRQHQPPKAGMKAEAQGDKVICQRSHSKSLAEGGRKQRPRLQIYCDIHGAMPSLLQHWLGKFI